MKVCFRCKENPPSEKHAWCGPCRKAYDSTRKRGEYQKQKRINKRAWLNEYKATLKCTICSENHPACLDFHHRDSSQKDKAISNAVHSSWGVERILEEIQKCDVLCANCHRKTHHDNGK